MWTYNLVKGKIDNIYTDSFVFVMTHDFGTLWKQHGFLTSRRDQSKNSLFVQELLNAIFLLVTLPITKVLGHSKLDSLEVKSVIAILSGKQTHSEGQCR